MIHMLLEHQERHRRCPTGLPTARRAGGSRAMDVPGRCCRSWRGQTTSACALTDITARATRERL
jgi:hypothetical protein